MGGGNGNESDTAAEIILFPVARNSKRFSFPGKNVLILSIQLGGQRNLVFGEFAMTGAIVSGSK